MSTASRSSITSGIELDVTSPRLQRAPAPHRAPPVPAATRRDLFGAMGALLLLTAAEAGPAKAAELDGRLLALVARWEPWERERLAVAALDGDDPALEARFDAYTAPWHDLMYEIMDAPARTPEGIHAKARVLRALLANHEDFGSRHEPSSASPSEHFAWSLVSDILGRAGA